MAEESSADIVPAASTATPERLPATTEQPAAGGEQLPGARKAAVLMAALGSERAANVLQRLGGAEIGNPSMEMASLPSVGAETTESIFTELAELTGAGELGVAGGVDFARGVIERALGPERAAELLGRLSARTGTPPFPFLP